MTFEKKSNPPQDSHHDKIGQARSKKIVRGQVLNLPSQAVLKFLILPKYLVVFQIKKDSYWVQISIIHSLQQERNKQILNRCHATISSGTRGVVYNNM